MPLLNLRIRWGLFLVGESKNKKILSLSLLCVCGGVYYLIHILFIPNLSGV